MLHITSTAPSAGEMSSTAVGEGDDDNDANDSRTLIRFIIKFTFASILPISWDMFIYGTLALQHSAMKSRGLASTAIDFRHVYSGTDAIVLPCRPSPVLSRERGSRHTA